MRIFINSQPHEAEPQSTLENTLSQLNIDLEGSAIAINNQVVPKSDWAETLLNQDDAIMVFRAIAGG